MAGTFTSPHFVGRERELARIADLLEAAVDGHSSTLLVSGSGGVGASRLLDEVERRIASLTVSFVVIRCRAMLGRDGDPYAPIASGLADLVGRLSDRELIRVVGTGAEELARLLPSLAGRLEALRALPERPTVTDPERRQTRMLESILGLLGRIGEQKPVLFVLEDLQFADAGTRALATFLARVSRPGRLCVVATYQPDELTRAHPLHGALAAMRDASRPPEELALAPLDRGELVDLIAGIEGERPSASVLLLVAERSRGNPLIAEELLAARRELAGASLTGTLEELVMARLAQRTPECRRLVRLLAPAGEPLRVDELAAAAIAFERTADRPAPRSSSAPRRAGGLLDPDLAVGLVEAIDHGFVVLDPGRPIMSASIMPLDAAGLAAATMIGFRHELIARAVEGDLLPAQRRRHHAALAAGLAARPVARARQWLLAHEPGPARSAAIEAAGLAEAADSPGDALAHLELALELDDRSMPEAGSNDPAAPAGLLARAAEAAFGDGRATRATAFIESAIARLDERADRVPLALYHERLGRYRRAAGDHEGSIVAHRRAVAMMPAGPTRERALVLASLAQVRMLEGMFSDAERLCREAIGTARQVGPEARGEEGHAICTLGISRVWSQDPETGVALLREARGIAEELGRLDDMFRATANLTTALDLLGRQREAVEVAVRGIEASRTAGQEAIYGNFLRGNGADSLFLLGRWEECRRLVETALEWSPVGVAFVNAATNLATVEIESQAGERAARLLGRLLLELETVPDAQNSVPAYRAAASFALWRGDLVDARRAVDLGWLRVRETEDWVLMARMAATVLEVDAMTAADARERRDLVAIAGARERSAAVLAEAEAAVASAGVDRSVGSRRTADAFLAEARAFRARLDGREEASAWDAIARSWETMRIPYEVARARWRQAEAALTAGDGRAGRMAAKRPLLEAVRIARELSARPLLRQLEELAGRALITLPAAAAERAGIPATAVVEAGGGTEASSADGGELVASLAGRAVSAGRATSADAEGRRGGRRPTGIDAGGRGAIGLAARSGDGEGGGPGGATGEPVSSRSEQSQIGRFAAEFVGPARPKGDPFGLSVREKEVLLHIAQGRTNREIGEHLFISQKTVGVHVGNILAKLGVSGRVEAAAVAIRLGLTDRR